MMNALIFILITLFCFFAPALVRPTGKSKLWLRRFSLGAFSVCLSLPIVVAIAQEIWSAFSSEAAMVMDYSWLGVMSLIAGTAVFWFPLLIIRIVQLSLSERADFQKDPT